MIELRQYQKEAVAALYQHLFDKPTNPCIVIPTGGGKTPVIATICKDVAGAWGGKVVILAHVKELLQQSANKLHDICPEVPFGIYSAGLNRRDLHYPVTIAGIQSIYKRAPMLGKVDLILVDEAHLIPPDGEGMYQTFLNEMRSLNPQLRIGGLTATPYRTSTGNICTPEGILNEICYEISVKELIVKGYLTKLKTKASKIKVDLSEVHVRGGEYLAEELEDAMADSEIVRAAIEELLSLADKRKSVLIFACGVDHAKEIVGRLSIDHCISCGLVTGETPAEERANTLQAFKDGNLKYLCNINVLTTGFDAPHIDCVAMMRPTLSPGLYYQMVGRGFRIHPGKENCLVLDYGENVKRHGPIDAIRREPRPGQGSGEGITKECPECQEILAGGYSKCPECGYEFPPKEPDGVKHGAKAGERGILSGDVSEEQLKVIGVNYSVHLKKGADPATAPRSMRVTYRCGFNRWVSEWVCLEHDGFARKKALAWWFKHSNLPMPRTADEAVRIASLGGVGKPSEIVVAITAGDDFERVTEHLGITIPPPESVDLAAEACVRCGSVEFEIHPGRGPHAGRKECAECGTFIKWVSKSEMRAPGDEPEEEDASIIDDETVVIDDDFDPFKDCPF